MVLNGGLATPDGPTITTAPDPDPEPNSESEPTDETSRYVSGHEDANKKSAYLKEFVDKWGHPDERDLTTAEINEMPAEARTAGEAMRRSAGESGKTEVNGETVLDNEEGVAVSGPVDGSDPTSIHEADEDELEASGTTDGELNDQDTVDEFVQNRNSSSSSGSNSSDSQTSEDDAGLGGLLDRGRELVDEHGDMLVVAGTGITAAVALRGGGDG
jgi:hypothetical protein